MPTTPPAIDLLPDPPLPTDAESVFDAKSGASLSAQQAMVPQINNSLTWMGQQIDAVALARTEAEAARDAAGSSAYAANGSKSAAAQSAIDATNNGAAQVDLAEEQVALAVLAKDSAEVAAAAAGAAAGLPSLAGNGRKVLRVKPDATGVEWGLGLPALPASVGKRLAVAADGVSVEWTEQHQVGDLLITAKSPGALWLPADGSIRSQLAYPKLFAAVGLIGIELAATWGNVATGGGNGTQGLWTASDGKGIVIHMYADGSLSRSTDYGATWVNQTTTKPNANTIATDGDGTWIITTTAIAGTAYRSTDNGLTWGSITLPSTSVSGWAKLAFVGNNTWIATATESRITIARSTNGGATWTAINPGLGTGSFTEIAADKLGVCMLAQSTYVSRSTDYGATWTLLFNAAASMSAFATDGAGTWLLSGSNANTSQYISRNNGASFTLLPLGVALAVSSITYAQQQFLLQSSAIKPYLFDGLTFSQVGSAPTGINKAAHAGKGILVALSATASVVQRSLPYAYDTATQFQLPRQVVGVGLTSYIKALEAA